jgi:YD repeat-containing protein
LNSPASSGLGTLSYQYDAASRRTRVTHPNGFYVNYDYDYAGAMTKVRENGASSGVGVLATYTYDDLGRRVSLLRGNGSLTNYGFDSASRLTSMSHDLPGAVGDQSLTFEYNAAGQISKPAENGRVTKPARNFLNMIYLFAAKCWIN